MSNKRFSKRFKSKEELIMYGRDKLLDDLKNVLSEIDSKYIMKFGGMDGKFYNLLDVANGEELSQRFENKSINDFKIHIGVLTDNIFKSLQNDSSYVSRCFYSSWCDVHRDLDISFQIESSNLISFCLMSYQKNSGTGNGDSFRIYLIDSEKLTNARSEVNKIDIPSSLKEIYLRILNEETEESNLNAEYLKEYVVKDVLNKVDDFICYNEEDYKNFDSLLKQHFEVKLQDYLKEDEFIKGIIETLTYEYGTKKATWYDSVIEEVGCKEGEFYTDENELKIKFLGEVIKTISKSSYTIYEIRTKDNIY